MEVKKKNLDTFIPSEHGDKLGRLKIKAYIDKECTRNTAKTVIIIINRETKEIVKIEGYDGKKQVFNIDNFDWIVNNIKII